MRMRRLAVIALCLATASPVAADGFYLSESFGGTDVKDQLAEQMSSGMRFRIAIGWRHRNWAVEGHFGAHFMIGASDADTRRPDLVDGDALTVYGLDVKYLQPVAPHLEVYLRGGASHALLETPDNYGGRGLGIGAGAQLKGRVRALGFLFWPLFFMDWGPKITAAVFVDTSYDFYRLHKGDRIDAKPTIDAQLTTLTFGFAVGTDF